MWVVSSVLRVTRPVYCTMHNALRGAMNESAVRYVLRAPRSASSVPFLKARPRWRCGGRVGGKEWILVNINNPFDNSKIAFLRAP